MTKLIRIAMVIPSFHPSVGGAERQLEALLPHLNAQNIEVTVITKKISGTQSREVRNGIEIIRCSYFKWNWTFLISLALKLSFSRSRFDLLHIHTFNSPFFIAALLKPIHRAKVIVKIPRTGQGAPFTEMLHSPFKRLCFSFAERNISSFIALNSEATSELVHADISPSKIAEIPNGVDTSTFLPTAQNLDSAKLKYGVCADLVLVTSGRLIKRKRVDYIIRTFAKLNVGNTKLQLIIVGDGPELQSLKELSTELQLGKMVIFTGKLLPESLRDILQFANIYISASSSEGMSNAILEAMACGTVPVCTDIPGNTELIEPISSDLLFEPDDSLRLINCLQQLIADSTKRKDLSRKVVSRINAEYSIELVAKRYIALYQRILASDQKTDESSP